MANAPRRRRSARLLSYEEIEARLCLSDVSFTPNDLNVRDVDGPPSLFAADLDGDGDVDVLSASSKGDKIVWYANTDGRGGFGPQKVLSRAVDMPSSVYAADVDGDGDMDVLSVTGGYFDVGRIAWYENTDGRGNFGPQQVIDSTPRGLFFDYRRFVHAEDIDSDGDTDVLTGEGWYENLDGEGTFSEKRILTTELALTVYAADFDGDGDVDILSSSTDGHGTTVSWFENTDHNGTFAKKQDIGANLNWGGPWSLYAADVDNDGDVDILSAHFGLGKIAWYENRTIGDSNDDGVFSSSDLVAVFQAGKYEDDIPSNATFDEGDWNQDGDFDSTDLVVVFQAGHYEAPATALASQIAVADLIFASADHDGKEARAFVA